MDSVKQRGLTNHQKQQCAERADEIATAEVARMFPDTNHRNAQEAYGRICTREYHARTKSSP